MDEMAKIAVVIPCYKVSRTITDVIKGIPDSVHHIVVVDDACPEKSGKIAQQVGRQNVTVIFREQNGGVGAAVMTGYKKAMEFGCDILVKIDGDGQMDISYLQAFLTPLLTGWADYTKGNRFMDFKALRSMPKLRLFGNNVLSFLEKAYSGYWNIMDPTNGYTAIHRRIVEKLDFSKIAEDYFFESHMLLHLNLLDAVICDVPIPARYGDEKSSLSVKKTLWYFPPRLLSGFCKRVFLKYFIYDFNMASVYILFGLPMFLWGIIFGTLEWINSSVDGVSRTAGTIMLAALPLILGFEMLLQAINIDIQLNQQNQMRRMRFNSDRDKYDKHNTV
jgi:glycosyltransferase involved in cell wall biosynthesis